MLTNHQIDRFHAWFLQEFEECMVEPEINQFLFTTCTNERFGQLIQNFSYDFIKPFLDGSLDFDIMDLGVFEQNCPMSYDDLETLNGLLYGHLACCLYCRHINSVHVANEMLTQQTVR